MSSPLGHVWALYTCMYVCLCHPCIRSLSTLWHFLNGFAHYTCLHALCMYYNTLAIVYSCVALFTSDIRWCIAGTIYIQLDIMHLVLIMCNFGISWTILILFHTAWTGIPFCIDNYLSLLSCHVPNDTNFVDTCRNHLEKMILENCSMSQGQYTDNHRCVWASVPTGPGLATDMRSRHS